MNSNRAMPKSIGLLNVATAQSGLRPTIPDCPSTLRSALDLCHVDLEAPRAQEVLLESIPHFDSGPEISARLETSDNSGALDALEEYLRARSINPPGEWHRDPATGSAARAPHPQAEPSSSKNKRRTSDLLVVRGNGLRDPLTSTFGPTLFEQVLEEHLLSKQPDSVLLMIGVDHFSNIVSTHGVAGACVALRVVANLIQRALRKEDAFARVDTAEFAVLLRGMSVRNAQIIAERIVRQVADIQVPWEGKVLSMSASAGITVTSHVTNPVSPREILATATATLGMAQTQGTSQVIVAPPPLI